MKATRNWTSKSKKQTNGRMPSNGYPAFFMQTNNETKVRKLKIEEHGDGWKSGLKPKIRLMGCWLQKAGFKPGSHVHIVCVSPGILEVRSSDLENQSA